MSVVRLPRKTCTHTDLILAIVESGLAEAENTLIKVQFQPDTFMTTAAMAQLCSWGLSRRNVGCTFQFLGEKKALSYPSRVDLFKHLGFSYEETYERREDEGRMIPLRLLTDRGRSIADAVEAVCELVAKNIPGHEEFMPALRWVVQELTDNVGNHSESQTPGVLCAQVYPRKKRVEFAVSDVGRGIKASLSGRYPKIWSHGDAITKAMEPGVTRDLAAGQGNGLSGSQEIIVANGGGLDIWSGDASLRFDRGRRIGFDVGKEFAGTGVSLSLRTNHPVDLRRTTLFDEGERSLHALAKPLVRKADGRLVVRELCEHVGGREPGLTLRKLVEEKSSIGTPTPSPVTLDFEGVDLPSSSFLDEVFGRFADAHGRESIAQLLKVEGAPDLMDGMIARVVSQRLAVEPDADDSTFPPPDRSVTDLLRSCCPARSAVCLGTADDNAVGAWWAAALEIAPESSVALDLDARWREGAQAFLGSTTGPCLLLPGWSDARQIASELLGGRASVAEALLAEAIEPGDESAEYFCVVPGGHLSSQRHVQFRNELWSRDLLRTVIGFSNRRHLLPAVHSMVRFSILHIAKPRPHEQERSVSMIDGDRLLEHGKLTKPQAKELKRLLGPFGKGGKLGYRFVWEDPARPLLYETYDPALLERASDLVQFGGGAVLADLLTFASRGAHLVEAARSTSQSGETISARLLGGRQLKTLSSLDLDDLEERQLSQAVAGAAVVRAGDMLLGRLRGPRGRLLVGVVPNALEGAIATDSVYILRFVDDDARSLALDFLRSDFVERWLEAEALGVQIPFSKLQSLPVPSPQSRFAGLVRQLSKTSADLRRVADEFDEQRLRLLSITTLREQVAQAEETSVLAASLDRSIRSLSDPSEQIRILYPLPIALSWRVMELEEEPAEQYRKILDVFETVVCYLGSMLVADLRSEARDLSAVSGLLKAFGTPGRGPSLGLWIELLRQAPALTVEEAVQSSAFPELRVLLGENQKSDWWSRVNGLLERRNDLAHKRGPRSKRAFQRERDTALGEIKAMFERLGFLARYRLTVVLDCVLDELEGTRRVRAKQLVGDHAVVPVLEFAKDREVGRGLYFSDAVGDLRLGSPWIEYAECPHCGHWEVTVPEYEKPEPPGGTVYKSLRTGHMHPGKGGCLDRLSRYVGIREE